MKTQNHQRLKRLKMLTAVFAITCICHLSFVICLYAAFDELNIGARPQGMGGAYTALADDANALFYNPAGIALLRKSEFTSNYGRLFMGLDDNSSIGSSFIGYAHPIKSYGTPGVSWYNLALSGMYSETVISLSYGHKISNRFSAGVSLKNLSRKFGSNEYTRNAINETGDTRLQIEGVSGDPVFANGKESSALTSDLGLLYLYSSKISFGFAARNFTSPNIGLISEDKVPAVYRLGAAYKEKTYSILLETVNKESDLNVLLGTEKWFIGNNIGLRSGLTVGSRKWRMISLGSTLRFDNFSFDYAFLWPLSGIKDTIGTHKLALTIRFGKAHLTKEEEEVLAERKAKIRAQIAAKEALLEAEKFQKEAERIKSESIEKMKRLKDAEEKAKELEQKSIIQETVSHKAELEKEFKSSMFYYQKRVSLGAEIPERLSLLDKIIKKYNNKGVDISDANREKSFVLDMQKTASKDYNSSISYYRRFKTRGASVEERKTLLTKIVDKYKNKGINISEAEEELKMLR
ncbi:MAG: type IX secretion system membrane protein PorP/SprF [Elusimicrobia bacterium]|nr:type IX secretion system membrane protein PorP/SprF [Elusimicrobiota bacterium]